MEKFRTEAEQRFADLKVELDAGLDALTYLSETGVADPAVGLAFYLALLNEGIIGDQHVPHAEFAARYLSEAELRILTREYDRLEPWKKLRPAQFEYAAEFGLPEMTPFEAAHRLARLTDFGFLFSDAAIAEEPLGRRFFRPDLELIDSFTEHVGLVRLIAVSPGTEHAAITQAYESGTLATLTAEAVSLFEGGRMHTEGGVIRRHLLDGYQWCMIKGDAARPKYSKGFATAAEAQTEATAELLRCGLPATWIPVAA